VRTKELIEASKEAREKGKASTRCAQDCCVADVPLPGVSLIALSHDESVLAACTDTEIQFFLLASLLKVIISFFQGLCKICACWISI
jgi:nuclear pore complex protein Nup214